MSSLFEIQQTLKLIEVQLERNPNGSEFEFYKGLRDELKEVIANYDNINDSIMWEENNNKNKDSE